LVVRRRQQQQQQQQQHALKSARKQLHIAPHTLVRFNGMDGVTSDVADVADVEVDASTVTSIVVVGVAALVSVGVGGAATNSGDATG
jgi:hypothetical protein